MGTQSSWGRACSALALLGLLAMTGSAVVSGGSTDAQKSDAVSTAVERPPGLGSVLDGGFSDDFDSYLHGSGITGQGTPPWELWDAGGGAALDGTVDNTTATSSPNSLLATDAEVDVVQIFDITSGQWQLTVQTYIDTSVAFDNGFVIMLNQFERPYAGCGTCNWSLQIVLDPFALTVESQFGGEITPLLPDQWVELVADIDLDADTLDVYYGGTQFVFGAIWSENTGAAGMPWIQAIDLYSQTPGMRWDDVSLQPVGGCVGDLDGDGDTDLADLGILLADFGCVPPGPCPGDLDGDGDTDLADLGILLADFGCTS